MILYHLNVRYQIRKENFKLDLACYELKMNLGHFIEVQSKFFPFGARGAYG